MVIREIKNITGLELLSDFTVIYPFNLPRGLRKSDISSVDTAGRGEKSHNPQVIM